MGCKGLGLLVLTALLPLSATAATITVRSGETLSEIADRYGVSTRQLMRLNGLRDSDYIEAGSRLEIPGPRVSAGPGRHRVQPGDTLDDIAARYRVSSRDLMLVNGLRNANHVEAGQTLKLPSNAVIAQSRPKPAPINVTPGASEHTVGRGQTLTQIAKAYELPVATLIDINAMGDGHFHINLIFEGEPSADTAPAGITIDIRPEGVTGPGWQSDGAPHPPKLMLERLDLDDSGRMEAKFVASLCRSDAPTTCKLVEGRIDTGLGMP